MILYTYVIRCPPLVIYTAPESDFARTNTGQSRNQHRLTANTETIIYIYRVTETHGGNANESWRRHIKIYSAERMTISWHWTFNQNPSYWEKKIYIFILCTGSIYVLHILYTWSLVSDSAQTDAMQSQTLLWASFTTN